MKGIFSIVSAVAIAGSAFSQDAAPAAPETEKKEAFSFSNFTIDETISFYDLGSGDITEFDTTFKWSLSSEVDLSIGLPVYTNGDTGLGMASLGLGFDALKNPTSWIDVVSISTGIELPAANDDFGGDSLNTKLGLGISGKTGIENLSWCAGADGTFVSDATFLPVFGGLVTDDVFHASSGLHYAFCKGLDISLNYNYWDVDNAGSISTLGPSASYSICDNAAFDCGLDVPVSDDDASDLDLVVRFGLNVKF